MNLRHAGIHGAEDVDHRRVLGGMVVEGPRRVVGADPGRHGVVVRAVARLVAERPVDDAGVVAVARHQATTAIHERVPPEGIRGQPAPHAVSLDVGLVAQQDAVFVAQLVPARHVRVVAGAHGVDVELLHEDDVAHHVLFGDDVAALRVLLVAVDALDQQRHAVEAELAVADLHLAEAHAHALLFQDLTAGARQGRRSACTGSGTRRTIWRGRSPAGRIRSPLRRQQPR